MRSRIALCGVLLLTACGGDDGTPAVDRTAHRRAAERICASAAPGLAQSGEGVDTALDAFLESGSRADLAAVGRAWDDVWYTMDRTRKELRATTRVGADRDYDRFVTAWAHLTNALRSIVDAHEDGFDDLVQKFYGNLDVIAGRLQDAARKAGVRGCEAPLTAPPAGRDA